MGPGLQVSENDGPSCAMLRIKEPFFSSSHNWEVFQTPASTRNTWPHVHGERWTANASKYQGAEGLFRITRTL